MNSLPKHLILKRGETVLATMTFCKPADEMFWLACDFAPTEAFAEIAALIDEASNVPDTDAGYERFEEIYANFHENGLRLINPGRQEYLRYWAMHLHHDGKVTIRWAEELLLEES
jgi:hypothetical protein